MVAYVDGAWVEEQAAVVPIHDRGFLLGDGVYDTCRVFEGAYFRFADHAERLRASGRVLRIDVPPVERLRAIADELLARNRAVAGGAGGAGAPGGAHASGRLDHAVLRITVTRGSGGTGVGTEGAGPVRVVATLRPLPADWRERARAGWAVATATTRHPPPEVMPPALKGQGRIFSLLARLDAEAAGCDDALLLSTDGHITEGATWNVFWRRGDRLRTPSEATGLLAGVTRSLVLEIARDAGYDVEEGVWSRRELDDADEAFATMTSLAMVPLRSLDGRPFPETGRAVEALTERYWARVREEIRG